LRAVDDSVAVVAGAGAGYADGNVLANDSDASGKVPASGLTPASPDGTVLVSTDLVRAPRFGAAYLGADGYFRYTPGGSAPPMCPVTDSFVYQIADAANPAVFSQATVTIGWGAVSPAVAVNDAVADPTGTVVSIDVSANDCAGDGAIDYGVNYVVTGFSQPGKGEAVFTGSGVFAYTPDAGAAGTDSFTYTVRNPISATGQTSTGTVTITLPAPSATPTRPPRPGGGGHGRPVPTVTVTVGGPTVVVNNPVTVNVGAGAAKKSSKSSVSVSSKGVTVTASGDGSSASVSVSSKPGSGGLVVVNDPVWVQLGFGGRLATGSPVGPAQGTGSGASTGSAALPGTGTDGVGVAVVGGPVLAGGGLLLLWLRGAVRRRRLVGV